MPRGWATPCGWSTCSTVGVCYRVLEGEGWQDGAVVHLGNHPHIGAIHPNQRLYAENCAMNANVFSAAADVGVKRLVFASSIQVHIPRTAGKWEPFEPSTVPSLPLSAASPVVPTNLYAASKVAGEVLLQTLARRDAALLAVAIRFPYLVDSQFHARQEGWLKQRAHREAERGREPEALMHGGEDAMAYLMRPDAARLIERVLAMPLPSDKGTQAASDKAARGAAGFHALLPSAPLRLEGLTLREVIERWYPDVPRHGSIEAMEDAGQLVDIEPITRLTGWVPEAPPLLGGWRAT